MRVGATREVLRAGSLFLVAALVGMVYAATWGGKPQFWQNTTFTQGLMWVCGHGFVNPKVSQIPGLAAFLDGATDAFDCDCIPRDIEVLPDDTAGMSYEEVAAFHPQPEFPGFLPWQRYHLYLVLAVTCCWWLFGVSWSALTPLCGLLYGTSAAAAYGLFRLGMGRRLATVCTLLLATAPLHLEQAPHIRDYSKAPFMLLALFALGCLLKYSLTPRRTSLLAGAGGAIIGLGLGFRTDLLICAPAFVAVTLFFLPGSLRTTWRTRLLAVGAFVAVFLITGFPILIEVFRETGHFAHVALLGFLEYCNRRLGVGSSLYHLGDPFSDYYMASVVQHFVYRTEGWMPPTRVMSPEYHEATQRFLLAYMTTFPADLLVRAYASVLRVVDELQVNAQQPWPQGVSSAFLQTLFAWRATLLHPLLAGGRYAAALALIVIASRNLRLGFACLFLLLYFAGYTAIQFSLRHAFHLEFLSLWTLGFLIAATVPAAKSAWTLARTRSACLDRSSIRKSLSRTMVFVAITAAAVWLPLQALRFVQQGTAGSLLEACATSERMPLSFTSEEVDEEHVLLRFPDLWPPDADAADRPVHGVYFVVACGNNQDETPVTFLYEAEDREHWDFSRTLGVPKSDGKTASLLFFPLYYGRQAQFAGVQVRKSDMPHLEGFYRVVHADALPLWLTLTLPPDWKQLPHYQSLTR